MLLMLLTTDLGMLTHGPQVITSVDFKIKVAMNKEKEPNVPQNIPPVGIGFTGLILNCTLQCSALPPKQLTEANEWWTVYPSA